MFGIASAQLRVVASLASGLPFDPRSLEHPGAVLRETLDEPPLSDEPGRPDRTESQQEWEVGHRHGPTSALHSA